MASWSGESDEEFYRRNRRTYGRQRQARPVPHRPYNLRARNAPSSSGSEQLSPTVRRVIMAARPRTPPQRPATPPSPLRPPSPFILPRHQDPVPEPDAMHLFDEEEADSGIFNGENHANVADPRDQLIQQLLEFQRLQTDRLERMVNENTILRSENEAYANQTALLFQAVGRLDFQNNHLQQELERRIEIEEENRRRIRTLERQLALSRNEAIPEEDDEDEDLYEAWPAAVIEQPAAPEQTDAADVPGPSGLQGAKRRRSSEDEEERAEKRPRPTSPDSRPSSPNPRPGSSDSRPASPDLRPGSPDSRHAPSPVAGPSTSFIPPTSGGSSSSLSPARSSSLSPASSSSSHSIWTPSTTTSASSSSNSPPSSPEAPRYSPPRLRAPRDSPPRRRDPRNSPPPPPSWRSNTGLNRYLLRTEIKRPDYREDAPFEKLDYEWDE